MVGLLIAQLLELRGVARVGLEAEAARSTAPREAALADEGSGVMHILEGNHSAPFQHVGSETATPLARDIAAVGTGVARFGALDGETHLALMAAGRLPSGPAAIRDLHHWKKGRWPGAR